MITSYSYAPVSAILYENIRTTGYIVHDLLI
jgi:hypothetical protein